MFIFVECQSVVDRSMNCLLYSIPKTQKVAFIYKNNDIMVKAYIELKISEHATDSKKVLLAKFRTR